jgi:exodeoxyribonuclease VII small subunit
VTELPSTAPEVDVDALAFDDAFAELQRVVGTLEAGGLPLEATIDRYERAVALQRRCEQLLGAAELRVQQLMARPGGTLGAVDVRPGEATEESIGEPGAEGDAG